MRFIGTLIAATGLARAEFLRVPEDYATIHEAIDAASQGDVIDRPPGA
jgi:hypothetical protein